MKFYTAEDLQQIMQIGHKQAEALMRAKGFRVFGSDAVTGLRKMLFQNG